MGIYKVVLPRMGESVSEATITKWVKAIGDLVEEDDPIVEIATDKVDSDVPSPVMGKLTKTLFEEGQVAQVGDVIAWIEVENDIAEEDSGSEEAEEQASIPPTETITDTASAANTASPEDAIAGIPGTELLNRGPQDKTIIHSGLRFYSPLVKNIAQEEGLSQAELDGISGTGAEGRVTKQDILAYIEKRTDKESVRTSSEPVSQPDKEQAQQMESPSSSAQAAEAPKITTPGDEIVEMDRMRRLIADHMVHSVKTSPHVASFGEADVTNLVNWRNKIKDS